MDAEEGGDPKGDLEMVIGVLGELDLDGWASPPTRENPEFLLNNPALQWRRRQDDRMSAGLPRRANPEKEALDFLQSTSLDEWLSALQWSPGGL